MLFSGASIRIFFLDLFFEVADDGLVCLCDSSDVIYSLELEVLEIYYE